MLKNKFNFKSQFRILKGGKISLVVSAMLGSAIIASASPSGGTVTSGTATISSNGTVTNIDQSTAKATINWQTFSIATGETVNFNQPSSTSITLNRVIGNEKSIIDGALNANGQVWLLNSNGVLFSKNASINTSGILATTAELSDADFNAGNYNFKNSSSNSVINQGTINVSNAGSVVLASNEVINEGTIKAVKGKVHLVGADSYSLNLNGNSLVNLRVDKGVLDAMVKNSGHIVADGGEIYLTTNAVDELLKGVVNNTGIIEANSLDGLIGKVNLLGNIVVNNGTLKSSSGTINETANMIIDAGTTDVSSTTQNAGTINQNSQQIKQSNSAILKADSTNGNAGKINIKSDVKDDNSNIYLSGTISATGLNGGDLNITSKNVDVIGSNITTSGTNNAGEIKIGGGWQGADTSISNASRTSVLNSNITNEGKDGKVVIWSEKETSFNSKVLAKESDVEISSKDILNFSGINVFAESLLLDPKNIEIRENLGAFTSLIINNPNNTSGDSFRIIEELSNGNLVAIANSSDIGGLADAGATYLFKSNGTLISTLAGSSASDNVGGYGVTTLSNGNYVLASSSWDRSTTQNVGAVTWINGTTGISGIIDSSNSLIGSTSNDSVGSDVIALSNGSYLVYSPYWNSASATDVGAVTWGDGTTGITGVVSSLNSLVGSTNYDKVGRKNSDSSLVTLNNGKYLINSLLWNNNKGAVTWIDGSSAITGVVSASNSLVGSTDNDQIGSDGITVLNNGNYLVNSPNWDNSLIEDAGAVTWGNGTTGITGDVSSSNSLTGLIKRDYIGRGQITSLSNGNYIVNSPDWNNGDAIDSGAITWGDGTIGIKGAVSSTNSLIGSQGDYAGNRGVTALSNGNYVVRSSFWKNGAASRAGAVTWGDGTTGINGIINSSNSLVGLAANDKVGDNGVIALSNGNYVISSSSWNSSMGAVTWGDGTSAITGNISDSNSLVGTTANDQVGNYGVTTLDNGNYIVSSPNWNSNKGAVTWGDGTTAITGNISDSNSLVGSTVNDQVGNSEITVLSNGNYVVRSTKWNNDSALQAGAVTWADGTTGITGVVSSSNSLVGSTSNDYVGDNGITVLNNGNYLVRSNRWHNGAVANAGHVTWVDGTTGITGVVSSLNSLVGTSSEQIGSGGIRLLKNGNYLVFSPYWDNEDNINAGAVTWGNATTGIKGTVSSLNSLVGTNELDYVGDGQVFLLDNGNYIISSNRWDNNKGAVTWGNGTTGISGELNSTNSFIGKYGISLLSNSKVALNNTNTSNGGTTIITNFSRVAGASDSVSSATFGNNTSTDSVISPTDIKTLLDSGTNVVLQANNDITLGKILTINNLNGDGGDLTFQAGRNINLNANLTTDNGNFYALAGNTNAIAGNTDIGTPTITLASGVSIDAGTGNITLYANSGNFVNNAGSTPFVSSFTSIYLPSYANTTLGGLIVNNKRYNTTYNSACLTTNCVLPTSGVNMLYSIAPVLTVTPTSNQKSTYGSDFSPSGYALSGFVDGDILSTSGISGTATYIIGGTKTSSDNYTVGSHDISYSSGILSSLGYSFADNTTVNNELTITPKGITVSADDLSKVYGQTDVALTYSTTGLETGDTLAGSLKRAAGEDAGDYTISEDTALANSNYTVTFTNGKYTITPRPITLVANESSKVYGGSESELTATVSSTAGLGLASNDVLEDIIGILSRQSGETVGSYDVLLGNGEKASNYAISYNSDNNSYTITPSTTNLVNVTLPTALVQVVANNNSNIVSQPVAEEVATQIVTLSEIKTNQENSQTNDGSQTPQDVRVPVSKNSIMELVNGGVNLPEGVDQQFFVVATTETQEN